MKQVAFLALLFLFSCELIEKNESLQIAKADIIGSWKQIDTLFVKSTILETGITTEYKFNEIYTFTNDDKFEVSNRPLFIFCDEGCYSLDFTSNQINFTCDLIDVEIGGGTIVLETEPKKMKWQIVDLIENILHVDLQYFDRESQTYGEPIRRRYLKQ
jgi:hypothetical protein